MLVCRDIWCGGDRYGVVVTGMCGGDRYVWW